MFGSAVVGVVCAVFSYGVGGELLSLGQVCVEGVVICVWFVEHSLCWSLFFGLPVII